ncbi:MAG: LysR family transcriptional regulator [Planctomycetia bacterium]|nr:LysR family transcriptional regulator [Planctomycetia bacterium]
MRRYKELRLEQLRAFCECVRRRSFSAAARALHRSQPAVWQQVRALERQLGADLLRRRGREVEPSEDGRVLLELAADILGNVDSLQAAFEERRAEVARQLTVISSPGMIAEELAQPVVEFCRRQPQVRLTLLSHAGLRTLDLLQTGEVDLVVLPLASEVAGQRQLLTTEPLCTRPWVLVLPRRHPLAKKPRLRLADIAAQPLILPERASNWRQAVDGVFRAAGLLDRVRVVLEVSQTLAARRYVGLGLGVAVLPLPRAGLYLPQITTRLLDDFLPPEEFVLVWRRGVTPSPQARTFADFIRQRLARSTPA